MTESSGDAEQRAEVREGPGEEVQDSPEQVAQDQSSPRLAAKIIHPKKKKPRGQRNYVALVRPLSLIAAAAGIFSLMLPWIVDPRTSDYRNLWSYIGTQPSTYDLAFVLVAGLVLLGSVLSLLSSTGAFATLAGLLIFTFEARAELDQITAGFYTVLIAVVLGMVSLAIKKPVRIWDRLLVFEPKDGARGIRVNLLGLVASALGIATVFLPWAVFAEDMTGGYADSNSISLMAFVDPNFFFGTLGLAIASSLFIFGAVLCIFTQLGLVPMLAGAAWSLVELIPMMASYEGPWYSQSLVLSFGVVVGIIAVVMALLSMVFPVRVTITNRLTVWRRVESHEEPAERRTAEPARAPSKEDVFRRLASHWRKIAVVAVVLGAVVAFAGLAYAMPLCKIELRVTNETQRGLTAFVIAYIDGEEIRSGYVSPHGGLIVEATSTAGVHTMSLDYAPVVDNRTALDGTPDWSSDLIADPFQKKIVDMIIFNEGWSVPEIGLENVAVQGGQRVTFTSVEQWSMGALSPATISWSDLTVILYDGMSSASWSPSYVDLTKYPAGVATWNSSVEMGSLTVCCNVTDLSGNGQTSVGDYLTITALGDIGFSPGTSYKIYIVYDMTSSLLAEVDFQGT